MQTPPDIDLPDGFDHVETLAGITEVRLRANGLQILLLPQAAAPVATFMVTYRVGSRDERTGLTGATHFLEHLMFKGTERFNKARGTSIFNVLQRVGAQVNATTWNDRTNYYELLPREHLPLALEIEADRMRGALIDPEEVDRERTVILNEFDRGENEPMRKLYQAVWSTAYIAHPYHHPTIGWRSDIESATSEGLRHFYDTYYWPNNATLSIIGDFDVRDTLEAVMDRFGGIPSAPTPLPEVHTREPEQQGERRVTLRMAGQLGALMLAYKSPSAMEEDSDALNVLAMALSSGKSSRLYRRLTDTGLVSSVSAVASRFRDPGLFYCYALLSGEATHDQVEAALRAELERVKEEGVAEAELQRARSKLKAQTAFARDGSFSLASQLNEAIAAGDWRLFATFLERIEAVTADDVRRVAQTYCVDDRCTVGRYVPVPAAEAVPPPPPIQPAPRS